MAGLLLPCQLRVNGVSKRRALDVPKPMKYSGTIKGGVVVLEGEATLREGTRVEVEPVEVPPASPALGQRLKRFSGTAKRLPNDMAQNHDQYLHDRPKK